MSNIYGRSDRPEDTGALDPKYNDAGKAAYQAYIVARGMYDEATWENLVWAEQYAWCEAARAARKMS